jgi:hypothetical protein
LRVVDDTTGSEEEVQRSAAEEPTSTTHDASTIRSRI